MSLVQWKILRRINRKKNSIGSGQVLSCGYEKEKAKILVKEMVESLALSLVDKHLVTNKVVLTIGYETNEAYTGETMVDFYGRVLPKSLNKIVHLPQKTNANSILIQNILDVYDRYVDSSLLVRRINVALLKWLMKRIVALNRSIYFQMRMKKN